MEALPRYLLTGRQLLAFFLSFFYVFDNALIVHSRGAMLEGPQIFFILVTILAFLLLLRWKDSKSGFVILSLLFGVSFGCVMSVKINGLILILLLPSLLLFLWPDWKRFLISFCVFSAASALVFVFFWQVHFSLVDTVNPELERNGYFRASEEYKKILKEGRNNSPASFPVMLKDSFRFTGIYTKGVPKLNLCKADENGSPAYFWPIGDKHILLHFSHMSGGKYLIGDYDQERDKLVVTPRPGAARAS